MTRAVSSCRWDERRWQVPRVPSGQQCACGCGEETFIAVRSDSRYSQKRGEPLQFLPGHHYGSPVADPAALSHVLAAVGYRGRRAAA